MERKPESFQLILTNGDGLGRLTVDLESFFEFSFSLASELQALESQFQINRPPIVSAFSVAGRK